MKKLISIILAVMMIAGIFAAVPITVNAGTTYYAKDYNSFKLGLQAGEDCTVMVTKSFTASITTSDRIVINGGNVVLNLNICDPISITASGEVAFCNLITIKGGSLTIKGLSRIQYAYEMPSEYISTRKPSALVYVDSGTLNTTNCDLYSVNGPAVKVNNGTANIGFGSAMVSQADWAVTDVGTGSARINISSKAFLTTKDQMGTSSQGAFEGYGALEINSPNTLLSVKSGLFGGGVQLKTATQAKQFSPLSKTVCCDSNTPLNYELCDDSIEANARGDSYFWYTYGGTYYYLSPTSNQTIQHPDYIYVNYYKDGDCKITMDGGTAKMYRGHDAFFMNIDSADSGDEVYIVADTAVNFVRWEVKSGSATIANQSANSTFLKLGSSDVTVKAVYKEGIKSVAVTGVSWPEAGETGARYAYVPNDADYTFSDTESVNVIDWYHGDSMLSATDKFEPGVAYEARTIIKVKKDADFFAEDVTATINGVAADIINHQKTYIVISRTFLAKGGTIVDTSNFIYNIKDDGTAEITKYTGSDPIVEIPSTINGYKVTEIVSAFNNNNTVVSVNIPDTVKTIGNSAFYNCSKLMHVTIPDGVESIGSNAFACCTALEEINIPSSVKRIQTYAFDGCTNLVDVILHEGLETVNVCAFCNCQSLTNVQIPNSVTTIVIHAFGEHEENSKFVKNSNFSITGYAGSEAERYANENGITFNTIEGLPPETGGDWSEWSLYSQATPDENGSYYRYKLSDPSVQEFKVIPRIASVKYTSAKFTYNGKKQCPKVTAVTDIKGKKLVEGKDYTVSYHTSAVNADEYMFAVFFMGDYSGYYDCDFYIVKAANTMTASASAKSVKFSTVKKKNTAVSAITVKNPQGTVSYKKTSGNSKITVNSKTGKLTVKKGLKKGTYTVKVKVSAKGTKNYKSSSKTVAVKIKVK